MMMDTNVFHIANEERLPCIEVSDVFGYIKAEVASGRYTDVPYSKMFPCVRPPFNPLWSEYTFKRVDGIRVTMGFYLWSKEIEKDKHILTWFCFNRTGSDYFQYGLMPRIYFNDQGEMVEQYSPEKKKSFLMSFVPVDDRPLSDVPPEAGDDEMFRATPMLMALSFMSCKNVETKILRDSPRALNEKRQRAGKPPIVRMYTLLVDGVKRLFHQHTGAESFTQNSLHLCRGHFKDFSHGGGLFGKYKGRYWWDHQMRGSKEVGVVAKDYKVKP